MDQDQRSESWAKLAADNIATIDKLETKLTAANAVVEELRYALAWCYGSNDFHEDGLAHEGWEKICQPLLNKLQGGE